MHLFNKCCVPHHHHFAQHALFLNVQPPYHPVQAQFLNVRPTSPVQQTAQFLNVQQAQRAPVQQQPLFTNLPSSRSRG